MEYLALLEKYQSLAAPPIPPDQLGATDGRACNIRRAQEGLQLVCLVSPGHPKYLLAYLPQPVSNDDP